MKFFVLGAVIAGLAIGLASGAASAAVSGTAVGVNPAASAQTVSGNKTLIVGADVQQGDKIVTGPSGQVQLVFTDDTHLVVGPNSALLIQSYLLNSSKTTGQFAVSALGGSFRFITGKLDHSSYSISTPTGTIGVRGTAFDFVTGYANPPAGTAPDTYKPGTWVALFRGAVVLCTLTHQCVTLNNRCDLGELSAPDAQKFAGFNARDKGMRDYFQYIHSQTPLLTDFRINEARNCYLDPGVSTTSLSSTSGGPSMPYVPPPPPCDECCHRNCGE